MFFSLYSCTDFFKKIMHEHTSDLKIRVLLKTTTSGELDVHDGAMFYHGQGLEDHSRLGCLSIQLVGLGLQSHPLRLCLAHCCDGARLRLSDALDLLCLSLGN